VVQRANIKPE